MPILSKAATNEFDSPLERLLASIANLRQQPTSKGAHFYRTSLRRFQAWNDVFHPHLDAEQLEALKFLDKLRRATGKLRDSAVHLELLEQVSTPSDEKAGLKRELRARRTSYRKKLKSLLRNPILNSIWRDLRVIDEPRSTSGDESSPSIGDATKLALQEYRAFVQRRAPLSFENLHEYRLECKRFRYTAELAGENPESESLVATWKQVQDVIGDWHDYVVLSKLAKKIVIDDSSLYSKLSERAEKKYQESLRAIAVCEQKLLSARARLPKKEPKRARSGRSSSRAA